MAQEIILAEQTLAFTQDEDGTYGASITESPPVLVEGEMYNVVWDGAEHSNLIAIRSDDGAITLETDGFSVGYLSAEVAGDDMLFFITSDTSATHTVAIRTAEEGTEEEPSTDTEETPVGTTIVLKDRNGNDVTYNGIETVTFDTTEDGVQATFTLGVEQTGKEVELDFSGGDQVVKADDRRLLKELTIKKPEALLPENIRNGINVGGVGGSFIGDTEETTVALSMVDGDQVIVPSADGKVLSNVVITKPETLIPENIAEGIDIAGIIGTLASGRCKVAFGRVSGGSVVTVDHNLGVIPDIVIAFFPIGSPVSNRFILGVGYSSAFRNTIPATDYTVPWCIGVTTDSKRIAWTSNYSQISGIEKFTKGNALISGATETEVSFGTASEPPNSTTGTWIAIGGLTK